MLSFAYKRYDGKVPEYAALTLDDINIINRVELGFGEVGALIEAVKLRDALQTIMGLVRDSNAYLDRAQALDHHQERSRRRGAARFTPFCA